MALNQSPENQSEYSQKAKEMRRSKAEIITSLSPDRVFPDSNAIKIGRKQILDEKSKRKRGKVVNNRKRRIPMLDIQVAKKAYEKMKSEVHKKKEETNLMKTELAENQLLAEEMESMLHQIKGRVHGMS